MNSNFAENRNARIDTLVEQLGSKLNNFRVVDRQGELIGQVEQLVLDHNRQLNLAISCDQTDQNQQYLLISKLIEKIDPTNKLVIVDIYCSQIEQLPRYPTTDVTAAREIAPQIDPSFQPSATVEDKPSAESSLPMDSSDFPISIDDTLTEEVLGEKVIRLLAERLVVDRRQRKIGEVIVRKVVETRTIQVPVRYEKLVIEQVNPEHKQLAEIDLRVEDHLASALPDQTNSSPAEDLGEPLVVKGKFSSPQVASLVLQAIAKEHPHGCQQVRVEILVEDAIRQQTYQEWIDNCSN